MGGKYIENTQLPGLVKQDWDWHINRKNPVSPEFTDAILESGKWIHLAKRLDFGNRYQHSHSHSHPHPHPHSLFGTGTSTSTDPLEARVRTRL